MTDTRGQRLSEVELIQLGFGYNPNLYIGSGYQFCGQCDRYTYHKPMSRRDKLGLQQDKMMCKLCRTAEK